MSLGLALGVLIVEPSLGRWKVDPLKFDPDLNWVKAKADMMGVSKGLNLQEPGSSYSRAGRG